MVHLWWASIGLFVGIIGDVTGDQASAGANDRRLEERRRLREVLDSRIRHREIHPRHLGRAGMLPPLQIGGLKLTKMVGFDIADPTTLWSSEIRDDHDLQPGIAERRLQALESVVKVDWSFWTPQSIARVLSALVAASPTSVSYGDRGEKYYLSDWGDLVYKDQSNFIYPEKIPCKKKPPLETSTTVTTSRRGYWEDPNLDWWCPESSTTTTTTVFVSTTTGTTTTRNVTNGTTTMVHTTTTGIVNTTTSTTTTEEPYDPMKPFSFSDPWQGTLYPNLTSALHREMLYLQATRKRILDGWAAQAEEQLILGVRPPNTVNKFEGLRLSGGCYESTESNLRCFDDIGVALSVFEDKEHKVIVFHGGFNQDEDYLRYAHKLSIIETMEDSMKWQWLTLAGLKADATMWSRRGADVDELAVRCAFANHEYHMFKNESFYKLYGEFPYGNRNDAEEVGLWRLVELLMRKIMPSNRDINVERTKQVLLTGAGLGGTFASLVSLWLKRVEGEEYETYAFAPMGFQCLAHRMYRSFMDSSLDNAQINIYTHPLDYYALLGRISGNVCVVGTSQLTKGSKIVEYCNRPIGFSGPEVMWEEGDVPVRNGGSEKAVFDAFLATLKEAVKYRRACLYFTHSAWFLAMLLNTDGILDLDGRTDGGCQVFHGVPKADDAKLCPFYEDVKAYQVCPRQLQSRAPPPIKEMMICATTVAVLITLFLFFLVSCYYSVDADSWVFQRDGSIAADIPLRVILCPRCFKLRKKPQKFIDRAKEARDRAKERIARAQREKEAKQSRFNYAALSQFNSLNWKAEWEQEMCEIVLNSNLQAIYIVFYSAQRLKEPSTEGRAYTMGVAELVGKAATTRIHTEPRLRCGASNLDYGAQDPIWNEVIRVHGFRATDVLQLMVVDVDREKPSVETGALLGHVKLEPGYFYPVGKDRTAVQLWDTFGQYIDGVLKFAIIVQDPNDEPPEPPEAEDPWYHTAIDIAAGKRVSFKKKHKAIAKRPSLAKLEDGPIEIVVAPDQGDEGDIVVGNVVTGDGDMAMQSVEGTAMGTVITDAEESLLDRQVTYPLPSE